MTASLRYGHTSLLMVILAVTGLGATGRLCWLGVIRAQLLAIDRLVSWRPTGRPTGSC